MEEMVQALFEQGVLVRNGAVKLANRLTRFASRPRCRRSSPRASTGWRPAEKELLQTLAVLGREFSSGLIRRVAGKSDDELERMLSELQLGEFIYEQPAMGDIEYIFKHALTQEVAYNSVLIERRRLLHERAAQAIEALYAERLEDHLPNWPIITAQRQRAQSGRIPRPGGMARGAAGRAFRSDRPSHQRRSTLLKQLPEGARSRPTRNRPANGAGWSLFLC